VNNGVYRCGFSTDQKVYDRAYRHLFDRPQPLQVQPAQAQRDADAVGLRDYCVHRDINHRGIVPAGPDLSGWLTPHGREALGGRPFGDETPPGPLPRDEAVPADHTPLAA
jgi:glutathionyl-hydroquinone reductase